MSFRGWIVGTASALAVVAAAARGGDGAVPQARPGTVPDRPAERRTARLPEPPGTAHSAASTARGTSPAAVPPAPASTSGDAPVVQMAGLLEDRLGLSPDQAGRVREILSRREAAVEAYHAELRTTMSASLRSYEDRIVGLRDLSYREIASLLDARQERDFRGLLALNALNDHSAFEHPDGFVMVD